MRTPHSRQRKPTVTPKKGAAEKGAAPSGAAAKDTSTWLTRHETSDTLTISEQTLANYERRGILHPRYDYRRDRHGIDRRVVVYDPSEVQQIRAFRPYHHTSVAPRTSGEVEARACELFRAGKSDEEVVVELRETFDRVDELRQNWTYRGGGRCVIEPEAWKALEGLVGPFGSIPELVEKLVQRLMPTTKTTAEMAEVALEAGAKPDAKPLSRTPAPRSGSNVELRDAKASRARREAPSGLAVEPTGTGSSTATMSAPCAQSTEAVNDESADQAALWHTESGSDKPGRAQVGASNSQDIGRPTGEPAAAPPESGEWPGDLVSATAEREAGDGSAVGSGPEVAADGAAAATDATASGLRAAQSPRELLLDAWLHSLAADDERLQRLGALLTPAEKVMLAELASTIGTAVAVPTSSRSLREQILDALIVNLTADQARLDQIEAVLTADERGTLAELRVHDPPLA